MVSINGNERVLIDGAFHFDNNRKRNEFFQLKGWVFAEIIRCVYRSLEGHTTEVFPKVSSYTFRRELGVRDHVALVDIDHCYLQVAHRLGYIGEKDYGRLLKRYSDLKIDICAAFTSLFKETRCTYIGTRGRVDRVIDCNNYELELVRDNIINYSNSIMYNWVGDFYWRNVDGIWVPIAELESLEAYLRGLGLKYKVKQGLFLSDKMLFSTETGGFVYL